MSDDEGATRPFEKHARKHSEHSEPWPLHVHRLQHGWPIGLRAPVPPGVGESLRSVKAVRGFSPYGSMVSEEGDEAGTEVVTVW